MGNEEVKGRGCDERVSGLLLISLKLCASERGSKYLSRDEESEISILRNKIREESHLHQLADASVLDMSWEMEELLMPF